MSAITKDNTDFGEKLFTATGNLAVMSRREDVITEESQEVLPDISALPSANPEILRNAKSEAERKKQWAHAAGARLLELEQEFNALQKASENDPDIADLAPAFKQRFEELEKAIATIGSVGEELRKHVQFAKLIEEIRRCPNTLAALTEVFGRALETGWLYLATEKEIDASRAEGRWPGGTFVFQGKVYFRAVRPGKPMIYPARTRFEKEMRQLQSRVIASAWKQRIASMREQATCECSDLMRGKKGKYYFVGPNPDDHVLLEISEESDNYHRFVRVVGVVDALGSFAWMKAGGLRQSIPLSWIQNGKIISERRLEERDFARALSLVRKIRDFAKLR
ncbi:MAG: hypothetical protein KGJ13_00030 [Patescibacteria group bacterium]|nr:hypothetical protein [Patescibacteria group bacterium]